MLALAGAAGAAEKPQLRPPTQGEVSAPEVAPAASAGTPTLEVRFDLDVVDRFLEFVERGSASREELERWVRLPGNRELLRQGRLEGGLTPAVLAEAAKVTLGGGDFPSPPTLGSLGGGDWGTLRLIVGSIRARRTETTAAVMRALQPYLPADRRLPPLIVYFHLGGSWDGRTTDAAFINLTVFQARGPASLQGLDALLVHELFHLIQAALLSAVEDYSSRQSASYAVLLRLQQEGIARHLEYQYLRSVLPGNDLDRTNLAKYEDALGRAADQSAVLARILDAFARGRLDEGHQATSQALLGGGPLYALGHAMADDIERRSGVSALAGTVGKGPVAFARAYLMDVPEGGDSLLPAGLESTLDELDTGYARDPVLASSERREGLARIEAGDLKGAIGTLRGAVRDDPSDATSAYNLACAYALTGRKGRALDWLERAFQRGFDNYKHAALDDDLEALRNDRKFAALLRSGGYDYRPASRPAGEAVSR